MTEPTVYAGFWRRVGAYMVDSALITVLAVMLAAIVGLFVAAAVKSGGGTVSTQLSVAVGVSLDLVSVAGAWLYFGLMESSSRQATVGKMAFGIHVTDLQGRRITFGRALARTAGKLLSGLTLSVGYLMVAFTERKQGLHDLIAGTLVVRSEAVRAPAYPPGPSAPAARPPILRGVDPPRPR